VNCYVLHAFESAFGYFMLRIGCVCMWLVFGLEGLSPLQVSIFISYIYVYVLLCIAHPICVCVWR